jgi:hypothetical protein
MKTDFEIFLDKIEAHCGGGKIYGGNNQPHLLRVDLDKDSPADVVAIGCLPGVATCSQIGRSVYIQYEA